MTEKQSVKWTATTDEEPPAGVWFIGVMLSRYVNAEWAWSRPISMFAFEGPNGRTYGKYRAPDLWMLLASPPLPESPERERAKRVQAIADDFEAKREALRQLEHRALTQARDE